MARSRCSPRGGAGGRGAAWHRLLGAPAHLHGRLQADVGVRLAEPAARDRRREGRVARHGDADELVAAQQVVGRVERDPAGARQVGLQPGVRGAGAGGRPIGRRAWRWRRARRRRGSPRRSASPRPAGARPPSSAARSRGSCRCRARASAAASACLARRASRSGTAGRCAGSCARAGRACCVGPPLRRNWCAQAMSLPSGSSWCGRR